MLKASIILIIILSLSCQKPTILPDTEPIKDDEVFELTWANRINDDKEVVNLNNGLIYGGSFLFTGDFDDPPSIVAFDTKTGEKQWEYLHIGGLEYDIENSTIKDNIYIAKTAKGLFAIDLNEKTLLWEIGLSNINIRASSGLISFGDYFYFSAYWNFPAPDLVGHMLRVDYLTGELEWLYSTSADGIWSSTFSPPAIWIDPIEGDTIMLFNDGKFASQMSPQDSPQDLVAVNISTQELVWKAESYCEVPSNLLNPPIVYKDNIITGGDWSMYSFNVRTGELNWRTQFLNHQPFGMWNSTDHLLVGDRLFVNPTGLEVICLDPATGDVIWNNPEGGPGSARIMTYYKDMLVFTSGGYGSVMILDAFTGETIHREHRYENSGFNNNAVYDQRTDMFFTTTFKHAVGFKINKP